MHERRRDRERERREEQERERVRERDREAALLAARASEEEARSEVLSSCSAFKPIPFFVLPKRRVASMSGVAVRCARKSLIAYR